MVSIAFATVLAPNLALHFDGNSLASVADCPALRLTDEMTFEAWVFPEEPIVGRTFAYLLSKNYGGTGYEVNVLDRPNHRFHAADFANVDHGKKPSLPIGQWTHVAYARSLRRAKLYINGELALETTTGAPFQANDVPLFIGSSGFVDQEGKPCRFIGSIDEVQIWDVARSEGNIKRTMKSRPTGRERHLVLYFPFDEGRGQVLRNKTDKTGPLTLGDTPGPDANDPAWVAGAPLR
jgi:hypothetical protein